MVLSVALVVLLVIALAVLLPAVALLLLPIPRLRAVKPAFLPAGDGNVVRRHTTNMEHG